MEIKRWLSLGLVLTLGFLLGTLGFFLWDTMPPTLERVAWSANAQWIGSPEPSYRFYLRHTFYLGDTAKGGWLRISADNDFILYVNGTPVAKEISAINNSLSFTSQMSDPSQRFNANPYAIQIHPIWLGNPRDWKLSAYIDIAPYLTPGKNVIALEIRKSQTNPRVVIEGAVYPVSEKDSVIDLTTGASSWKLSNFSETHQQMEWFAVDFPDQSWREAQTIAPVREATYSWLTPHLFNRLLQGNWISGTETPQGEVWLRGYWQAPPVRRRAFLRFAGDSQYGVMLNGSLIAHYGVEDNPPLHLYEVTKLLKTGTNVLAVRLARPLNRDQSEGQDQPLRFFLDGWVETAQNQVTATIETDSYWQSLTQPVSGWEQSMVGQSQSVTILGFPESQLLLKRFEGDANLLNYSKYLLHQVFWQLGGMGVALGSAWGLGQLWFQRRQSWWDSLAVGSGLLLPGTFFLIGMGLLKHRYAESEIGLLFAQPQTIILIWLGFLAIVALTPILGLILLRWKRRSLPWDSQSWLAHWQSWGQWVFLVLIIGVGFVLRIYDLDFVDLYNDECVSYDAARGILRTGAPQAVSGIWYTRSPAYHYLLALWLRLVGDSIGNARFLTGLWGTATLVFVFIFTRKITQKTWIALVVIAILAIDPWMIVQSRMIRFYQVLQCFTILAFWLFFEGFIDRKGRSYQYGFFVALTLAILNQEVAVTLLPCFFLGFLFFYKPFRWSEDWSIVLGSFLVVAIGLYDVAFVEMKTLTPWVGLSTTTNSIAQLHLLNITSFFNMFFVHTDRMHTIYSFFFGLGFLYFLKQKQEKILFIFISIFLTLLMTTVLIYQTVDRYTFSLYPLFIMLSIYSAIQILESIGRTWEVHLSGLLPVKKIAITCLILLLIFNLEPFRVLAGYREPIFKLHTPLMEYVRVHRQPGDVLMSSAPFVGAIVLGKVDYYIGTTAFDKFYQTEGQVIDRWSGGVLISNVDQIIHVLEKANRVWLHLDDGSPDYGIDKLKPEYFNYLESLGQPVLESYGSRLRLWQPKDGLLPRIPNQGRDLGNY